MFRTRNISTTLVGILLAAPLAACGGDDTARLEVLLTDAPAEALDQVLVTVGEVHARHQHRVQTQAQQGGEEEGTWLRLVAREQTHDLLQLRDGKTAALGEAEVAAGDYQRLRLQIRRVRVVAAGTTHEVDPPAQVEFEHAFRLEAGNAYQLVLDLDAEQSVSQDPAGGYAFDPVLSVKQLRERSCQAEVCAGE